MNLDHAEAKIQSDRLATDSRFPLLATLPEGKTRADQIEARWRKFHSENPRVWIHFQKFVWELINKGRTQGISPDMILHRVRFEMAGEIVTDEVVRLNNDHARFYGDLFRETYPQQAGCLSPTRRRTSEDRPACDPDIGVHDLSRKPNAAYDEGMAHLAHLNSPNFSR